MRELPNRKVREALFNGRAAISDVDIAEVPTGLPLCDNVPSDNEFLMGLSLELRLVDSDLAKTICDVDLSPSKVWDFILRGFSVVKCADGSLAAKQFSKYILAKSILYGTNKRVYNNEYVEVDKYCKMVADELLSDLSSAWGKSRVKHFTA